MKYDYEYLKGLSPEEFKNFYTTNMRDKDINNIIRQFVHDFIAEDNVTFLMGNNVQTPGTCMFIQVCVQGNKAYWRQVECGKDFVHLPEGPQSYYSMDLDELESALFFGMTRCEGNLTRPYCFRRCNSREIAMSDMLDYLDNADESKDGMFSLSQNSNESVNRKYTINLSESKLNSIIQNSINKVLQLS